MRLAPKFFVLNFVYAGNYSIYIANKGAGGEVVL